MRPPLSVVVRRACALAAAAFLATAGAVHAAPPKSDADRWAVLVGVDDYTLAGKLQYCGADQRALRDRLLATGFPERQVFLLDDSAKENRYRPSKGNIERQVDAVLKTAADGDLVVLGFSGHGTQIGKAMYLVPGDGDPADPATLVSLDRVYDRLRECPASLKLVIVDACRNDTQRGARTAGVAPGARALSESLEKKNLPEGVVLLNSCAPGEISWEEEKFGHGVFMHYVLEGLAGKAEADGDGAVSINELAKYAAKQTKSFVLSSKSVTQRPYMRNEGEADLLDVGLLPVVGRSAAVAGTVPSPFRGRQQPGDVVENSLGMKLVVIPAGELRMGSVESRDEQPVHNVRITRPFLLGQTEVTLGQFLTFYNNAYKGKLDCEKDGKGGEGWKGPAEALARSMNYRNATFDIFYQSSRFTPWSWGHRDIDFTSDSAKQRSFLYPVVNVSWNDCNAFCEWLSGKEGKKYRLPTEAEWEYACRAGTNTRFWTGDDPESLAYKENVMDQTAKKYVGLKEHVTRTWNAIKAEDGQALTAPVGSFRSNDFGLYDMAGNVSEWCGDWWGADYVEQIAGESAVDPRGPPTGSTRVMRGGSWISKVVICRSACRLHETPSSRFVNVGFRVVLSVE